MELLERQDFPAILASLAGQVFQEYQASAVLLGILAFLDTLVILVHEAFLESLVIAVILDYLVTLALLELPVLQASLVSQGNRDIAERLVSLV